VTAGRTRELGYADAMDGIATLVHGMLEQVDSAALVSAGQAGVIAQACLQRLFAYAHAVAEVADTPRLTIADRWILGDGFEKTWEQMNGGAS
jgi:hypothetical protein